MKKKYSLSICLLCFLILNILLFFNNIKLTNNQRNYFRLHIVANSNSIDDQIIKLNVTKKINEYLDTLYQNIYFSEAEFYSKDYIKSVISNNIDNIIEIANKELKKQDVDYSSHVNLGKIKYDKKLSDTINMDKGIYDSIQIILGEGAGENFWSLIFPYTYNPSYTILSDSHNILKDEIKFKSSILETMKIVVKTFKS